MKREGPAAELVADAGDAAAEGEFFRSPEFLGAEGATHTLRISGPGGELLAPLIVRADLPGGRRDAVSPYGYPGFASRAAEAVDPTAVDYGPTGLVSLFVRHALGREPPLLGATARNTVFLADPGLPRKSRMSDRQQVRRNERSGYEVRIVAGPQSSPAERHGFFEAYTQTMIRARAAERYMYPPAYFDRILAFADSWLALCEDSASTVAAASVLVRSDGLLHYHLSGTADEHLRASPMKNVVTTLADFAEERGMPLNLGGGITAGDRLEEFKRGFANRELQLHTSEVVCDAAAYEQLSARSPAGGFFPAYRAG